MAEKFREQAKPESRLPIEKLQLARFDMQLTETARMEFNREGSKLYYWSNSQDKMELHVHNRLKMLSENTVGGKAVTKGKVWLLPGENEVTLGCYDKQGEKVELTRMVHMEGAIRNYKNLTAVAEGKGAEKYLDAVASDTLLRTMEKLNSLLPAGGKMMGIVFREGGESIVEKPFLMIPKGEKLAVERELWSAAFKFLAKGGADDIAAVSTSMKFEPKKFMAELKAASPEKRVELEGMASEALAVYGNRAKELFDARLIKELSGAKIAQTQD